MLQLNQVCDIFVIFVKHYTVRFEKSIIKNKHAENRFA